MEPRPWHAGPGAMLAEETGCDFWTLLAALCAQDPGDRPTMAQVLGTDFLTGVRPRAVAGGDHSREAGRELEHWFDGEIGFVLAKQDWEVASNEVVRAMSRGGRSFNPVVNQDSEDPFAGFDFRPESSFRDIMLRDHHFAGETV